MHVEAGQDAGDQLAHNCKEADDGDHVPVHSSGKVNGDPEKYKENNQKYVFERPGVLFECIWICCSKCNSKRNYHHCGGNTQVHREGCGCEHGRKRKDDRKFVITVKNRDEKFL